MRTVIVHFKHSGYFYIALTNKPDNDTSSIGKSIQLSDLAEYLGDELEYNFLKDASTREDLINEFINDSKCLNNKDNIPEGPFNVVEQDCGNSKRIVIKRGDQYISSSGFKPKPCEREEILYNCYLYVTALEKANVALNRKLKSIKYHKNKKGS